MRKHSFLRVGACLTVSVLCAALLSGCKHKEITLDDEHIINYTAPAEGEEIAVLTVKDYGQIKIKLFPEEAPKGVENFKKLIEQGFYDELIFHRVVNTFVIQTGDPKGNGQGGEDAWGEGGFEQTISNRLAHTVGAVAYAINPEEKLNKSQFYIVTGEEITEDSFRELSEYGMTFSPYKHRIYEKTGGQPSLDGNYEIFGQVIDGMEVALEVQKVAVDASYKPKSQILLEKAELVRYDGSGVHWLNWNGEEIDGISDTEG